MPKRIKVILFDMDGVLVDVSRSYRRAIEETVEHFTGYKITPATIQRYKNTGGFNDDWKLTHTLILDLGMRVPFSRVVEEFQRRYRGEHWDGFIAQEPPLVRTQTLVELRRKRYILGIVTGRPAAEARWTLERFGWHAYFPLLVAMEHQDGRHKPDPFPLQRALAMLDTAGLPVTPERAVYIGDSVDDVEAAQAAGLTPIGVVPPYLDPTQHAALLRERGAAYILTNINDLPNLMEKLEALPLQRAL
jgi:HAD superfamily phosphatase